METAAKNLVKTILQEEYGLEPTDGFFDRFADELRKWLGLMPDATLTKEDIRQADEVAFDAAVQAAW